MKTVENALSKWPELSSTGPYQAHTVLDLVNYLCNRARLHHSFSKLLFTMDRIGSPGYSSARSCFKYTATVGHIIIYFFPKHQRTTPWFANDLNSVLCIADCLTFLEGLIIAYNFVHPLGRLGQSYPKFIAELSRGLFVYCVLVFESMPADFGNKY